MQVRVFAAGSHSHSLPGGATPNTYGNESAELVQALLEKAGYTKELDWEVRIDKMLHCSAESRPVRVQSHKPYGVTMRVKPQPHATVDQLVTLYIPEGSGYSAKNLFEQLKGAEKGITRNWRKELPKKLVEEIVEHRRPSVTVKEEPKPKQVPVMSIPIVRQAPPELPTAPPTRPVFTLPERPVFGNLVGIPKDKAKLKYVLAVVHQLSQDDRISSKEQFLTAWRTGCTFHKENFYMRTCGRVLQELVRRNFIKEVITAGRHVSYTLTYEGKEIVGLEITPEDHREREERLREQARRREREQAREKEQEQAKQEPAVVEPPVAVPLPVEPAPANYASLLIEARGKMQELVEAGTKLERNQLLREELKRQIAALTGEIEGIDREDATISKVMVQNREAFDLLKRLLGFVTAPLSVETTV